MAAASRSSAPALAAEHASRRSHSGPATRTSPARFCASVLESMAMRSGLRPPRHQPVRIELALAVPDPGGARVALVAAARAVGGDEAERAGGGGALPRGGALAPGGRGAGIHRKV